VLDVDGDNLVVRFKDGVKTVRTTYLQAIQGSYLRRNIA
jgi:hypothetical protein